MAQLSRDEVLAEAARVAAGQAGGTLATMHADDGTPYVTFVLFHLRPNGEVLFGTRPGPQHAANMRATPEVSFLIDDRQLIDSDWTAFSRIVVEGRAEEAPPGSALYAPLLEELRTKDRRAAFFAENGSVFRIVPRRIILMRGLDTARHEVDFDQAG